jgi:hypothetical protein
MQNSSAIPPAEAEANQYRQHAKTPVARPRHFNQTASTNIGAIQIRLRPKKSQTIPIFEGIGGIRSNPKIQLRQFR